MYILKVYLIHYTLRKILKKSPSDKINGTRNALPLFSFASSNSHSFIFNLWFSYELKRKVRLWFSSYVGFSIFRFVLFFFKAYVFVQQNAWTLWLENVTTPSKIKIIEKPHTVLLPGVWFLSCNKKFENSRTSACIGAPQKLTWWQVF